MFNIRQIKKDWQGGMTHEEIMVKHGLTQEQEKAISEYSKGLSDTQIMARVAKLQPGMKMRHIRAVMADDS